ncbi:MAG: hypothetical protein JOZ46_04430 [Candidatus Dormibacteraeota bacterium]|nr:hypothetical protein [Candidatus Dormibacteraeota bacterium]MBV9525047.1 hypothetical protein [Candidatus Dormibacteraeota bacterium]
MAAVGAGVTAFQLSRPGMLFGITPDVSAWFGASIRLVHGAAPYRDFFLSQPPGFTLLATPFALLSDGIGTRNALAVMRLCTPMVAAANVLLIACVVGHRGRAAVVVAGAIVALAPAMLYAIQGPMLEPLLALFCLLGIGRVFDGDVVAKPGRVALGGASLGFAVAIKLSAIVPALVLALLLTAVARRVLPRFVAGLAAGFGVPSLAFIALAPAAFARDVIGTQLNRVPSAARLPAGPRLSDVTGTAWFGGGEVAAAAIFAVAAITVVLAFAAVRRPVAPLDWFAMAAAVAVLLAQLAPAVYYPHYAALTAPFIALILGLAAARLAPLHMGRAVAALGVVVCAALLALDAASIRTASAPDYATVVDSVIPAGGCTLSDAPSKLVTSDRFVSARAGCTMVTDPNGAAVALIGDPTGAAMTWQTAFQQSDYVVTDHPVNAWYISATPSLLRYIAANFRIEWRGGLLFYMRSTVASRM